MNIPADRPVLQRKILREKKRFAVSAICDSRLSPVKLITKADQQEAKKSELNTPTFV